MSFVQAAPYLFIQLLLCGIAVSLVTTYVQWRAI